MVCGSDSVSIEEPRVRTKTDQKTSGSPGEKFEKILRLSESTLPAALTRIKIRVQNNYLPARVRPAIIAQAAATAAVMMPYRFFLGLGTGENLNEHITGWHWPPASQRLEMLEEAVAVIRLLWQGGWQSHYGKYYTVEQARIFT